MYFDPKHQYQHIWWDFSTPIYWSCLLAWTSPIVLEEWFNIQILWHMPNLVVCQTESTFNTAVQLIKSIETSKQFRGLIFGWIFSELSGATMLPDVQRQYFDLMTEKLEYHHLWHGHQFIQLFWWRQMSESWNLSSVAAFLLESLIQNYHHMPKISGFAAQGLILYLGCIPGVQSKLISLITLT